jgi:hypothetical protein
MTIEELFSSKGFDAAFGAKAGVYRAKFLAMAERGQVLNAYISSKEALDGLNARFSWNWAAFLFGSFWAIYRGMWPGWLALSLVLTMTIAAPAEVVAAFRLAIGVFFGFFGDNFLLRRYLLMARDETRDVEHEMAPNIFLFFTAVFVAYLFLFLISAVAKSLS